MGANTRHYRALMKKNFINWKRTPCGSICEILCPILLMLILVYARSQINPVSNDDWSLYSLRRPYYPIAKPEIGEKYSVSMADQQRQLNDYKDFFNYMDAHNIDLQMPVEVTSVTTLVREVAAEIKQVTRVPVLLPGATAAEGLKLADDLKADILVLTDFTALLERTPIKDFTKNIAWDSVGRLLEAFGLEEILPLETLKAFVENIEEQLENPEALLKDLIGFDISAFVTETLDQIPTNEVDLETYLRTNFDTININIQGYLPLRDPFGPFFFFPKHCYPNEEKRSKSGVSEATRYNSPVIAYVKTGASVEQDIVEQMKSLFAFQKTFFTELAALNILGIASTSSLFDIKEVGFIREDEIKSLTKRFGSILGIDGSKLTEDFAKQYIGDESFTDMTKSLGNFTFKEFQSKVDLEEYISSEKIGFDPEFEPVCFGFAVHENDNQNKYELELFFNDLRPEWMTAIPNQKQPVWNSYDYSPKIEDYNDYLNSGFGYMQNWVANTILKRKTGIPTASIVAMTVPARLPPYTEDEFGRVIEGVLTFIMIIMFVPPVYRTTYRIVSEKESKVKESMRMMGLGDFAYWASWFTYYTIVNTIISVLTWVILFTKVTPKTEGWISFFMVWLFGQSLFGILLVTQSLFSRARAAAITTTIIYFGTATFQYFVSEPDINFENKMWACLSPVVAMIQTVTVLAKFEQSQVGSLSSNLFSEYNNFTVGHGLIMLAFDCVWILLLGVYLEQVMPKKYGRRRHPCFIFSCKFWGCFKSNKVKIGQDIDTTMPIGQMSMSNSRTGLMGDHDSVEKTREFETQFMNSDCYEKLTPEIDSKEAEGLLLKVSNLRKVYNNGFKAVDGINVKMYTDQIFCLLGHNGAGKTTTVSMLSGLIENSGGKASLFGSDIFGSGAKMEEARKNMGVCPQHDVLFDLLTPAEHLDIFYEFKGADQSNKKKEINQILEDIGVADKKDDLAKNLSGGNKRKLSVAIALCGNSKFVLLDEPSSGLDIQARRQLWNMLQSYKKDKIILLTTHYMDEAEILADRIGIMTQGRMTCLGSSMFLKSRFGVGYVMTIVKNNPVPNEKILPYMHDKLGPDVCKLTEIQGEMTIQIPREYTVLFKDFFTDFDFDLGMLDIQTYGISVTTLEQVFLEIGHDPNPKPKVVQNNSNQDSVNLDQESVNAGIDKDETTQGGLFTSSRRTPGQYAKVAPLDVMVSRVQKGKNDDKAHGETLADAIVSDRVDDYSDRRLFNRDENSDSQAISFLPSMREIQNKDKGGFGEINRSHDQSVKSLLPSQSQNDFVLASEQEDQQSLFVIQDDHKNEKQIAGDIEGHTKNGQKLSAEDKPFEKFSLSESVLDTSFCKNFEAVILKRFQSGGRNKARILCEVLLPSVFLIFGVWLSSLDFSIRSDERLFTPSLYPLKQKLLMNENVYDTASTNISPRILAENLPDYAESFDVTYRQSGPSETFDGFADEMFAFGIENAYQEPYMYGSYEIYQADILSHNYKFVSYVNMTSSASSVFYPQFMYESILKTATGDPEFEFRTRSTPYPVNNELKKTSKAGDAGTIIFFSAIAYSIIITLIVSYLVVERVSQLKHVQVITGMRLSSYWIANFIFDAAKLYITVVTTVVLFHVFDQDYPTAQWVFVAFPFGIIPFTYVFSFCFTADSAAQTFTMFCHMFVILAASTVIFILRVVPNLEIIGDQAHSVARVIPSYSIATALYTDASLEFMSQVRNSTNGEGADISADPWDWSNNTMDIVLQFAHFFFWTFILFLIETDLGKRLRRCKACLVLCCFDTKSKVEQKLDTDVQNEAKRVDETPAEQMKIKVQNLRKVYNLKGNCCTSEPLIAVDNLSFGLEAGETFALLGVNGAGKTTTFKTLTSEIEPTSGSIHIGALNIATDFNKIKKLIGYCPQTNPIFDYMTVEENIYYFASIKGIPKERRNQLVDRAITQLDLIDSCKKLAGTLSGGNKRKLSVAMAIIGNPPIILLDEPSAGMDPEARRKMWQVVEQIASDKTSAVVLTTHSMEEAEALSTKMGIMVKGGTFKCFGTSQHIKDKFGTGFVIEIKAQMPIQEEIDEVREGVLTPESVVEPELKEALMRPTLTTEEASKILSEAQVPGILIESILKLDQPIPESHDENEEAAVAEILKNEFTLNEIATEVFVKGALFGVIESLCHEFINVEVIESYGSYMRLRVERHEKSIGFLFKLIEELKDEHQLDDYSVSQTTLEQIFQGFADLKFNENVPTYCIDEESGELAKIIFEDDDSDSLKEDIEDDENAPQELL